MIQYSSRSARAMGFLKSIYNDIEIYVEDSSNPAMWLRIFQRLLPAKIRLSSVNALRGRETVIDACRRDQAKDGRSRIYVIDGDFDHVRSTRKVNIRGLYRIRAYCIENLIVKEKSILEVAIDASGETDIQTIGKKIDLNKNIYSWEPSLRELFYAYAAVNKCAPSVKTVGQSITSLLVNQAGLPTLSEEKIRKRMAEVLRQGRKQGDKIELSRLRKLYRANGKNLPLDMVVSGKDYIFPLIWLLLRRISGYNGSKDQLKVHLATQFHQDFEPYFARALRRAIVH